VALYSRDSTWNLCCAWGDFMLMVVSAHILWTTILTWHKLYLHIKKLMIMKMWCNIYNFFKI
jgi:hypothetical protein